MTLRKTRWLAVAATLGALATAPAIISPFSPAPARAADATGNADQKVQAGIDRGLGFLKSRQQPDGGWQRPNDPPAITAIVVRAFAADPKTGANADFVKKGYDKLLTFQKDDGSISQDLLNNYNTAIAISALAAANNPAFKEHIDRAVAYVKGLQWTDKSTGPKGERITDDKNNWWGGWGYSHSGRPDLSNAQMAVEALENAGLKKDDPAFQNALKFITRTQNNSETNDQKFAGNDGGFVYTPVNDGDSPAGVFTGADGKRVVRSYGSMTYAGLKSMIYAGLTHDDPRVKAAWDWISKNYTVDVNPGFVTNDPKNGDMSRYGLYYYYHTMARALNVYDQPTITDGHGQQHDWRVELTDKLLNLQKPDGSWAGEKKWFEDNNVLTTAYAVLALQEIQKDLKEHPAK
ncbi:MAG TPA: prenyltransferase/squalene oxidase repeat-containing protein [Tepidisphaeraceae bacterium]|jgi:squalene-hopene/tetraprenyl-beta-curcumene cyclase